MSIRKDIEERRFTHVECIEEPQVALPGAFVFVQGSTPINQPLAFKELILKVSVSPGDADPVGLLDLMGCVNRDPIGPYPAGSIRFTGIGEHGLELSIRRHSWNSLLSTGGNYLPIQNAKGEPPYPEVDLPEEEPAEVEEPEAPTEEAPAGDEEPAEPEADPGAGTTEPAA